MSKSSTRVRVIQLQEWMKTLKSQRVKQLKQPNQAGLSYKQRISNGSK